MQLVYFCLLLVISKVVTAVDEPCDEKEYVASITKRRCPTKDTMLVDNKTCVMKGSVRLDFKSAEMTCFKLDHIVLVEDSKEKKEAISAQGNMFKKETWLSLVKRETDEHFMWRIRNKTLTWSNWALGEPRLLSNEPSCVLRGEDTKWRVVSCAEKHGFGCEYSIGWRVQYPFLTFPKADPTRTKLTTEFFAMCSANVGRKSDIKFYYSGLPGEFGRDSAYVKYPKDGVYERDVNGYCLRRMVATMSMPASSKMEGSELKCCVVEKGNKHNCVKGPKIGIVYPPLDPALFTEIDENAKEMDHLKPIIATCSSAVGTNGSISWLLDVPEGRPIIWVHPARVEPKSPPVQILGYTKKLHKSSDGPWMRSIVKMRIGREYNGIVIVCFSYNITGKGEIDYEKDHLARATKPFLFPDEVVLGALTDTSSPTSPGPLSSYTLALATVVALVSRLKA